MKTDKRNKDTLYYIVPAKKPSLAFNFFDVTNLEQLKDKEPTQGKKKEKKENNETSKISENNQENIKTKEEDQAQIKKAINQQNNEIPQGQLRDDPSQNKNKNNESIMLKSKKEDNKNGNQKRKIIIKEYYNAFNVSNNKLTTIAGIHNVLMDLLPELSFKSELDKVQLIQWIDISRNKLTDISPDICKLKYLKILYVHGNNIQEISKVTALHKCPSLTSLTLYGNPIDHIKGYRFFIIEMCPLLEKLDSAVISEKELDIIKFHGSRYGEVRNKKGEVIRYPKLPKEIIETIQMQEQNSQEKKEDN